MSDYVKSLPNELLLVIFDGVPLSDLLLLDQVCPRWATLLSSACARRQSLVLIVGGRRMEEMESLLPFNDDYKLSFATRPYYDLPAHQYTSSIRLPYLMPSNVSFKDFLWREDEDDDSKGFFDILYRAPKDGSEGEEILTEVARLREAYSSDGVVTYLTNLFPNIVNLVVIHDWSTEHDSLIGLVGSWSLVTLKLWANFDGIAYGMRDDHSGQHPVHILLRTIITKQPSLQQLTLNIHGQGASIVYPAQFPLFILRLKVLKLSLGNYDPDGDIWDLVHRGDSANLRQIGMAHYVETDLEATILSPQFRFTAKVRQLFWQFVINDPVHLANLCQRYRSLTLLRLRWTETLTFTELASNLASLPQLTHLELYTQFHHLFPQNPFALLDQAIESEGGTKAHRISLPQVKNLVLHIDKRSHLEFESLPPFVFPSVEVIVLTDMVSNCSICGLNGRAGLGTGACHRKLVLSLKNKFAASLDRLYSSQGFIPPDSVWTDWSNFLRLPDDQLPEVGDLEDLYDPSEDEDEENEEDDFEDDHQDGHEGDVLPVED